MFEVKVTIEAPELQKAIDNLADSIGKIAGFSVASMTPAGFSIASTTPAVVSVENPVAADTAETKKEEAPVAAPAPVEQPVAAPAAPDPAPAKKYTFKQISKAGAALCTDMGKMDQLVSLLNTKYGVPAITMINEARYSELAADLIALGATIEEE